MTPTRSCSRGSARMRCSTRFARSRVSWRCCGSCTSCDSARARDAVKYTETKATAAKRLAASGAALFAVGIITGLRVSISITDHEASVVQHMILSAHLNALLGGLWLIAIAATFAWLRYE